MNKEQKVKKVEALRETMTVKDACKKAGIGYAYYYALKSKQKPEVVTYKATTRPKYTRKARTSSVNNLTVIMGTTEQVAELLRGLK